MKCKHLWTTHHTTTCQPTDSPGNQGLDGNQATAALLARGATARDRKLTQTGFALGTPTYGSGRSNLSRASWEAIVSFRAMGMTLSLGEAEAMRESLNG